MKTIEPFINAGWHTVPLRGKLERLEDGSKTQPKFEKNWRERYQEIKNTVKSSLGGAITGKVSGIIAIDCDNDNTYKLFKSLDPDYDFVFVSKGKGKDCGTFIYQYDEDLADTFSLANNDIALDIYGNHGFVYLPTEANQTKVAFNGRLPELKEMPAATKVLVRQMHALKHNKAPIEETAKHSNLLTTNCIGPLVEQFANTGSFMPGLFRIITPKSFRDNQQYVKQGFLHPNNIADGEGSEYLSKVSAILGKDLSVSADLYIKAMHAINDLWDSPMDPDRLDNTICNNMIEKKVQIDGKVIWQYDENWQAHRVVLHTKRQSNIEVGFDDNRAMYYVVDVANIVVKQFLRDTELMSYVTSVAVNPPKKDLLKRAMPLINVTSYPGEDFGFMEDSDPTARTLNTFVRTPELAIMADPKTYEKFYQVPTTTLNYLETLIPEETIRNYVLRFIKRKLTTFEYSPVILYFLGVHGSGKDTFVQILENIMGKVARPTTKEFLEMFNGWLLDSYFVQLDEYGNQLTRLSDKEEALGKLKAYTGKQSVQIRQMRTDGFTYKHNATFIMTANKNPLMVEDGDRRIAFIPTPNVLGDADWIIEAGGAPVIHKQIMAETKDFCYYLATEVDSASPQEYMKPPESESKRELIADSMFAANKIAYCFKHGMKQYLTDLALEHECDKIITAMKRGRVTTEDLEELYDGLTDMRGEMRTLNKAMKSMGTEIVPTTNGGTKVYYYKTPWLQGEENPFEEDK